MSDCVKKPKILIAEDDEDIADLERLYLRNDYDVTCVHDGSLDYSCYTENKPDLVVLDLMLPGDHGNDICRKLRQDDPIIPIIAITSLGTINDKTKGFERGFNDSIVKPFEPKEMLIRIKSLLKTRSFMSCKDVVCGSQNNNPVDASSLEKFGDITIDLSKQVARGGDKKVSLSRKEFDLLVLFVANGDKVLSREFLLNKVWKNEESLFPVTARSVDTCVKRLRRSFSFPTELTDIETVKGFGYKLVLRDQQ